MRKYSHLSHLMRQQLSLPSPMSISNAWSFGSMLGLTMAMQITTGIFLAFHYSVEPGFDSVIHIVRDVPGGFYFRFFHVNGATLLFSLLYLHLGRALYFQSYITQPLTYMVGLIIFVLAMAISFLGYILPWGQMSFWGATVITNLFSAIPYLGPSLVTWMWGGYSVGSPTLSRFFVLHFLLPFVMSAFALVHLVTLHTNGSTSPIGSLSHFTKIPFSPYFTWKDMVGFSVCFSLFFVTCFYYPFTFSDAENFMPANPMVTPIHIQPEWYFLFAYAILRCVPSKVGGVLALASSIIILFVPVLKSAVVPRAFSVHRQILWWMFVTCFVLLTFLGAQPVDPPFEGLSQVVSVGYFSLFLMLI